MMTKSGRSLSEPDLERLAEAAEVGFDLAGWNPHLAANEEAAVGEENDSEDELEAGRRQVSLRDLARALDQQDNNCGRLDCGVHIDEALAHRDAYERLADQIFWRLPVHSPGLTKSFDRVELAHALVFVDNPDPDQLSGIDEALRETDGYTRLAALVFAHLPGRGSR